MSENISIVIDDSGETISTQVNEAARGATGQGVPTGGTTGQVLSKSSNADYATTWTTGGTGDLLSTNNLSDLADAATALANLGAATSAQGSLADTAVQPAELNSYLPLAGGTMTGDLNLGGFSVNNANSLYITSTLYFGSSGTQISVFGNPTADHAIQFPDASGDVILTSSAQTLTDKTLTLPTINGYKEGRTALGTVISSATIVISAGTIITAKLTASTACTFTMPTAAEGLSFLLYLAQATTTGNGTATFTGVDWGAAGAYAATATAGKMDILSFTSRPDAAGTGWQWAGSYIKGFTPT